MWLEFLLTAVESILNRIIALDPAALADLSRLGGKSVALEITDLKRTVYLRPGPKGISLTHVAPDQIDTTLSGSSLDFVAAATRKDKRDTPLRVDGDADLAASIQGTITRLDIDWEEELSHACGDVLAHEIVRQVRGMSDWCRATQKTLETDLREYLVEESGLTPHPIELGEFLSDVDRLRADSDRIEARIERLRRRLGQTMEA
ncbi:MAG: hypothetical protein GC138_05955 [Gammaproteobacteria bacterium]|nr:hypothetical protein [Gammaproteobacteria bacterium]